MNSQINNHPASKDAFWSKPASQLFKDLASSAAGLSASAASERLDEFGPNALSAGSHLSGLAILANQFKSPIILILIFATLISAVVKDWIDAAIILAIIAASSLLSFFQEYNAHNAAEKLKNQIALKSSVLRDGTITPILSREVVPGDVVLLSAGSYGTCGWAYPGSQRPVYQSICLDRRNLPGGENAGGFATLRQPGGTNQLCLYGHQCTQRQRKNAGSSYR